MFTNKPFKFSLVWSVHCICWTFCVCLTRFRETNNCRSDCCDGYHDARVHTQRRSTLRHHPFISGWVHRTSCWSPQLWYYTYFSSYQGSIRSSVILFRLDNGFHIRAGHLGFLLGCCHHCHRRTVQNTFRIKVSRFLFR